MNSSSLGVVVTAPGAERGHELVRVLVGGPEVAKQGVEVVGGFDPLLACEGF
jgi:hypothetical protein